MQPADDPSCDYKDLVRRGYDACAQAYTNARAPHLPGEAHELMARLPDRARVLDIGCGSGKPLTAALAQRYNVTGIDISAEQIRLARSMNPTVDLMEADIMSVEFERASFDAVVSLYTIFHIPREQHAELFRRIRHWLVPTGYLLASVATHEEAPYLEDDFFGVRMYWSNWGLDDYRDMLARVAFDVLSVTTTGHGYGAIQATDAEAHPLIFAQRKNGT